MTNILITGCSSGIGLETALFLNKQNIKVYASARDENDVKMLQSLGLKAFKIDVTKKEEITFALNEILKPLALNESAHRQQCVAYCNRHNG